MSGRYIYTWNGEAMVPKPKCAKACDQEFVIGQEYWLVEEHDRSLVSHNHQFAWLKDAWMQLPECYSRDFPSPEHLRKRALIEAGYFEEQTIEVGSLTAAIRVADAFRARETYSLVFARSTFVHIRTAQSQSVKAMGGKKFQESKQAILEVIALMIDVPPAKIIAETGKAA